MASDNKVLVTHESLEVAVSLMARVMELPVPERKLKLYHPDEIDDPFVNITECFVDSDEGYICLPREVGENIMFHEAAHWVLVNNGYDYHKGGIMYGLLYAELLAILAQITLTGSTYEFIFTKDSITEEKKRSELNIEAFTFARKAYVEFLSRDDIDATREELEANIANCDEKIAIGELRIKGGEFLYWHFGIEEKWEDAIFGKRDFDDLIDEFTEFHRSLRGQDLLLNRFVVERLAHRAAVSHYIHQHKPKDIFDGLLKNGSILGQEISFIYFMFSAKWARQVFEEKEVEKWMREPRYLTR